MDFTRIKDSGGRSVGNEDGIEVNAPSRDVYEILNKTNKEDPAKEDVQALRKALKEYPDLWRQAGDLVKINQEHLIGKIASASVMKESLRHGTKELRRELGYEQSPPLERLLIEQVVLCWLHYHRTQHSYINRTSQSIPITQADFWERKMSAAQRRYLRAVESLARIRRYNGRSGVQINIAQQQVNMS